MAKSSRWSIRATVRCAVSRMMFSNVSLASHEELNSTCVRAHVQDLAQLRAIRLRVRADLVPGQGLARLRASGRIADHPGEVPDDDDDLVAELLEVAQFLKYDGVPEVQVGRGGSRPSLTFSGRPGLGTERSSFARSSASTTISAAPRRMRAIWASIEGPVEPHVRIIATTAGPPRRKLPSKPHAAPPALGAPPRRAAGGDPRRRRARRRGLGLLGPDHPAALPALRHPAESFEPSVGSKIYDENDELITEFHVERRIFVPLSPDAARPPGSRHRHGGPRASTPTSASDPMGIARAIYQNFRRGRIVEGGSTITQQLAKVLFLTPDTQPRPQAQGGRPRRRAGAALFERPHPRDVPEPDLLSATARSASRPPRARFFGKGVSELAPAECALLRRAAQGTDDLLAVRASGGGHAGARHRAARMVGYGALMKPSQAKHLAGTASDWCRRSAAGRPASTTSSTFSNTSRRSTGADLVFKGGLNVYTTLVPSMQLKARVLATRWAACAPDAPRPVGRARNARPSGAARGALARPRAADRLHPRHGGRLRLLQERVQPRGAGAASTGLRLQAVRVHGGARGRRQTPASVVDDSPIQYPASQAARSWKPDNYDRKFRGPITYQQALEESGQRRGHQAPGARRDPPHDRHRAAPRRRTARSMEEPARSRSGTSDLTLLELTSGLRRARQPGHVDAGPPPSATCSTRSASSSRRTCRRAGRRLSRAGLRGHPHACCGTVERGTGQAGEGTRRPGGGEDGHDQRLLQRLVHRLHAAPSSPACGSATTARRSLGKDETGSRVAVPIWTDLHDGGAARATPTEDFPVPRAWWSCRWISPRRAAVAPGSVPMASWRAPSPGVRAARPARRGQG